MDDFVTLARSLITIGLALLLVMLRLDAGLGVGIAVAMMLIHPTPQRDLYLGTGDRLGAVFGGLAYGLLGIAVAVGFATYRYHRIRFPDGADRAVVVDALIERG